MTIIDVSDRAFKHIFEDKSFDLPIRWDGRDFSRELNNLLDRYIRENRRIAKRHKCL